MNLITEKSPQPLIDAYLTNAIFHAVVTKHEIAGSEYTTMLEDAVSILLQETAYKNELLLKYARRYGHIDADEAKVHIDDEKKVLTDIVDNWKRNPGFYAWRRDNKCGQNNGAD